MPAFLIDGGSHLDAPLSNFSLMNFSGSDAGYVGGALFPMMMVEKQSDGYYVMDPDSWLRIPDTTRAPKAPAKKAEWQVSTDTYFAKNYAQRTDYALETVANADASIRVRETGAMFVTQILMRDRERRIANLVSSISNVGSGVVLSGGNKWSDFVASDPISDVRTASAFIRKSTGFIPNVMVMDEDTIEVMRDHPLVRDYYKYTIAGPLTDAQLAQAFRVQRVLHATGILNTAKEGAAGTMANIWGNVAVLAYVSPTVGGIQTATAGMAFTWAPEGFPGPMAVERYMAPDPSAKTEYIEAQYFGDEKITGRNLIYTISGTL